MLVTDVETRCDLDLKEVGAWIYSRSPYAGLNCAVVGSKLFKYEDCKRGGRLAEYLTKQRDAGEIFVAHNAQFEHAMYANILDVDIPPEQWICTQALVAYYGLPQSLDGAAKALGLSQMKDTLAGSAAMKKLCKSDGRKHITPEEMPDTFETLYGYCEQDVLVTTELVGKLPKLPALEQKYWEMSFRMNLNGLPIDWFHLTNALEVLSYEKDRLDSLVQKLTNGEVQSARQTGALAAYLGLNSVNEATVKEALLIAEPGSTRYKLLVLRQQAGLASVAKFEAIKQRLDTDSRLRGEYWYFGAHTGRWTASGAQVQNTPGGVDEKLCEMLSKSKVSLFLSLYPKPMAALKKTVRGVIAVPEEKRLVTVDLSQIEARGTAWLGGEDDVIALYKAGQDVYCHTASTLFGKTVTKADYLERQGGKTAELSLGFGGGISAMERGCAKFGVDIDALTLNIKPTVNEEIASEKALWYYNLTGGTLPKDKALVLNAIKLRWRESHPNICLYWNQLWQAFKYGGSAGLIKVDINGKGTRTVTLPSGRQSFYRNTKISASGDVSYEGRFNRTNLIPGKLFENVVQACDADIIRWYMIRAEEFGLMVGQMHDAYTIEIDTDKLDDVTAKLQALHKTQPDWTKGLPIACEMKTGRRLT